MSLPNLDSYIDRSVASATEPTQDLGFEFVDGDTVRDANGVLYRLQGFDAPEVSKIIQDKNIAGTAGGQTAAQAVMDLAVKHGYTKLEVLPEEAAYGRKTAVLRNAEGRSLNRDLIASGVFDPVKQTTDSDLRALAVTNAFGHLFEDGVPDDFKDAAKLISDSMLDEGHDALNFKVDALTELGRVQLGDAASDVVGMRRADRDIDNNSLNPFSDAFDTAMISVTESAYGMAELLGHQFGSETLEEVGQAGVYRARDRMSDKAKFILDYKEVDNAGDAFDFVANNIAMSIPYMAATVGGVLAAPVTYGASLSIPVGLYTGNIYNEQEEKNPGTAVAGGIVQMLLDRLGLKGLTSLSGSALSKAKSGLTKDALEEIAKGHSKTAGISLDEARDQVVQMSKQELARLSEHSIGVIRNQLNSKSTFKEIAKRAGQGVAVEGVTEAMQEAVGYTAAHMHDGTFNFEEMTDRMVSAVVAGGAIGGTFGTAGGVFHTAGVKNAEWLASEAENSDMSNGGKYYDQEIKEYGRIASNEENAAIARNTFLADIDNPQDYDINKLADQHESEQKTLSWGERMAQAALASPKLWRGSMRWIIGADLQTKSRAMRQLADMFGSNLQKTFSGANFENYKHHLVSKYKAMVAEPVDVYSTLNGGDRPSRKQRAVISDRIYDLFHGSLVNGKFDVKAMKKNFPDVTPQEEAVMASLTKDVNRLGDRLHSDQKVFNPDLGYVDNYLFTYKAISKEAVNENRVGFIQALQTVEINDKGKKRKLTDLEAKEITDKILDDNSDTVTDLDLAIEERGFSVTTGTPIPGSHRKRSLGLSTKGAFKDFYERDIFANISNATKSAARFQAYQQFVGKNGGVVTALLNKARSEGVSESEINRVAHGIRDFLDAESGNYKRATTEGGKKLERVQRNLLFFTTIASLPLATVSSLPELAITMKGLTREQIFGSINGGPSGIQRAAKEISAMLTQGVQEVASVVSRKNIEKKYTQAQQEMREYGFYDWDVGAATKTGVTETSALKQNMIEFFFKANGLQGFTQMTRAIRVSIAGDFIFDNIETLRGYYKVNEQGMFTTGGQPKSREVMLAEEALRNIGIDYRRMLRLLQDKDTRLLTESENSQLNDMFREATFNFVNDAIMLPRASNRPLIYQDPRWAMVNQFQGFISTFQAVFIPKLWGEYVKRGSPTMKYEAFSLMVMMIMLGFVSQDLKDRLKFGESNPYLDDAEYIRRGISSSGLLGTSERVINTLFPIYEKRSDGVLEYAYNEGIGQSPALGLLENVAVGTGEIIQGETERGAKKLLRATPVAPITGLRTSIAQFIGDEFEGDN